MIGSKNATAKWYAVYVKSRYEKKTSALLARDGVEVFLPLITRVKQWSDRKKKVEEPLFKSYVFVRTDLKNYFEILNVPGVVKFISFEGRPIDIPENQIVAITEYVGQVTKEGELDVPKDLQVGQLVMIKYGAMKGLQGHLTNILGKQRIIVDIEVVGSSLPLTISKSMVEPV